MIACKEYIRRNEEKSMYPYRKKEIRLQGMLDYREYSMDEGSTGIGEYPAL
jgi:hypothetical protein